MPTVLIVEDVELNAWVLNAGLREYNVRCVIARTGIEALQLYAQVPQLILILMDINLPELDGLSATKQIRASAQYRARPIPIIAITGTELDEPKHEFLARTGLDDYITKPLTKEKLAAAVRRHLLPPLAAA